MLALQRGVRLAAARPTAACPRLCRRPVHVTARPQRRGAALRVAAEARPGTAAEAELRSLLVRLREDDVEYFDLKTLCKEFQLGGRDSKENLRAKLLRRVRQELGLPVFGPDNAPPGQCAPQLMAPAELASLFESRGVMAPTNPAQSLILANALLIADGLLTPEQAVWPEAMGPWSTMTVAQLKGACTARGLLPRGLRDDLIRRLEEHDAVAAAAAADDAAGGAAGGGAPTPANAGQLEAAQALFAGMHGLEVGQLREEVQRRGLKTQGTRQVLLAKLSEALEREVAAALGGDARLAAWAASAVGRLSAGEVAAELAARGVRPDQHGSPEAAAAALQAAMQRDWVAEALQGGGPAAGNGAAAANDAPAPALGDEWGEGGGEAAGAEDGAAAASAEQQLAQQPAAAQQQQPGVEFGERAWAGGRAGDPTLSLALLVGGPTQLSRDAALAGARLAAQLLQSDASHGLLPSGQLAAGEGGEREGVAVAAYYAAGDAGPAALLSLSWEQLHACSAAELDARAAAAPPDALAQPAALAAADAVLPLGLPPGGEALLAAAGERVAGSSGDAAAAALAADRAAFTAAAAAAGFAVAPTLTLTLPDLAAAAADAPLRDLPAHAALEAFAEEHLPPEALPRLAVRAEFGGSVLGGYVATGARGALLAALALMQEHGVGEVVVEAAQPGATHFTCTVLAGPGGPVALPPTQLECWDVEEDIAENELQLERWLAAREGLDAGGVEALLELLRQDRRSHPAHLGGAGGPAVQLRQSTPPAGLSAEATQAVRDASLRLFGELGLRDFAQFSGWVVPPRPAAAAQQQQDEQAAAGEEEEEQRQQVGRTFAELRALDEAVRAEDAAALAAAARRSAVADAGDAGPDAAAPTADEPAERGPGSAQLRAELAAAAGEAAGGGAAGGGDYGYFSGILIDDSVRETCEEALARGPHGRPIPNGVPEPRVGALPDVSGAAPTELCALRDGSAVAFATLALCPDLGSPAGVLCQQAAAVGLSHEGLLRQLASAAASRGGAPPLPPLPEAVAAAEAAAAAAAGEGEEGEGGGEPAGWGLWASLQPLDEPAVLAGIEEPFEFSTWSEAVPEADEAGAGDAGGFRFVDATSDPSLDPAAQLSDDDVPEPPIGYDEIREGAPYGDAGGDWAADGGDADEAGGGDGVLERMHPTKQRVWVLLGGDGTQRTQSLLAGIHAVVSLRADPELLVEAFLLEPTLAGGREEERRRYLLHRRLELLQLGLEDEEILQEYPELDLSRIRNPPPGETELETHGVWRLSDSALLRGEVEDLQAACERALAVANASLATLEDAGGDIAGAQLSVARQELALSGVPLDGSAWGGAAPPGALEPARYTWLSDFVAEAQQCGAVVLMALGGQPAAHGPLQRLLDAAGVPHSGGSALAAETCADKAALVEQLIDLSTSGISTAPQQKISLPELAAQCADEASADRLFELLRGSLGAGPVSLCIKPAHECGGLGAARVACGRDLAVYQRAVSGWAAAIPGEALAASADVAMPVPPPALFVVEPWIVTEPVRVVSRADGSLVPPAGQPYPDAAPHDELARALHWPAAPSGEWLAVSAALLGEAGRMRCLGPSVRVLQLREAAAGPGSAADAARRVQAAALAEEAEDEEDEEAAAALREAADALAAGGEPAERLAGAPLLLAGAFDLTPPPPTLASPSALASARLRLEMVADRLGLSGAAEVSGYMQVGTGEVVVGDVRTTPDLSPGALIFRQAAAAEPPLSPGEVLQELVRVGLTQPLEERDDMQVLGYPEPGEDATEYDYPREAAYAPYPSPAAPYPDAAEAQGGGGYGAVQQW